MKTEDVMTRRVVAARADTDLSHVARLMWENDCGVVPVVDAEDKVVGILTDRDVCMSAHFEGRALRELRAGGCMASEIVSCRASDGLPSVARLMGEKRVRRLPVTDDQGRLLGLISMADLFQAAGRSAAKEKKQLQAALIDALSAISTRPVEELAPAPPANGKRGAARTRAGKKRAKV